jgi:hypothetical protein
MLIGLVITFCLSAQPDRCMDRTDFDAMPTVEECILTGQRAGAQWVAEHPAWVVRTFSCRRGGRRSEA